MRSHEGGYFLRLNVYDRPGAMATIATQMAVQQISLESIVQHRTKSRDEVVDPAKDVQPIILVTHECTESAIRAALDAIKDDGCLVGDAQMIRIEKLN